jgi:hypothetical protein
MQGEFAKKSPTRARRNTHARQQSQKLIAADLERRRVLFRPLELAPREPLIVDRQPVPVLPHDLHELAVLVAKHEQAPRERVVAQKTLHHLG